MATFTMDVSDAVQSSGEGGTSNVDWDAMNEYVIECAKTANKTRSLKGVISGIMDLGIQAQYPYEEDYTGTSEQDKRLEEGKAWGVCIKEENGKQILSIPQKPVKQVAITVDFPSIQVNKGQFFEGGDDTGDKPLRLLLNGEFYNSDIGKRVVGRGYSIKERKYDDGVWAFAKNNMIHKLADACGLLDEGGYFTKDRLGELIGECAQFEVRVYMKPSKKNPSKTYFTEEIKLSGMIPENDEGEIVKPKFDEDILYMTNFNQPNDASWLKQLRASVKNTMALASNYEDSVIKGELEAASAGKPPQDSSQGQKQADPKPKANVPEPKVDDTIMFDDDLPF